MSKYRIHKWVQMLQKVFVYPGHNHSEVWRMYDDDEGVYTCNPCWWVTIIAPVCSHTASGRDGPSSCSLLIICGLRGFPQRNWDNFICWLKHAPVIGLLLPNFTVFINWSNTQLELRSNYLTQLFFVFVECKRYKLWFG